MVQTPPRARRDTVRWPTGWARLGDWRGRPHIAQITVTATGPTPSDVVDRCLDELRTIGYQSVVTSALLPDDTRPFLAEGFEVREHLHLLQHDLEAIPPLTARTRRARRSDQPAILEIDRRGFDGFWRFDADGLADAIDATPFRRVRAGMAGRTLAAYAITGRAGTQGYLQRIGVGPSERRAGWATALIADSLAWLRRKGAARALVNTQFGNDDALHLYERCGFTRMPVSLVVMERSL